MPTSKRFTAGVTQGGGAKPSTPRTAPRTQSPGKTAQMHTAAWQDVHPKKMRWPGPIAHSTSCMSATLDSEEPTAITRFVLLPLPTAGDAPRGLRAHTGGTPPGPRRQLKIEQWNTPPAPPAKPSASQCPTNCICIPPSLGHPAVRSPPPHHQPANRPASAQQTAFIYRPVLGIWRYAGVHSSQELPCAVTCCPYPQQVTPQEGYGLTPVEHHQARGVNSR